MEQRSSGSDAQEQEVEEYAQECREMDEEPKTTVKNFIMH